MDWNHWTLYLGVIALVIVLPGPAALLCINSGVQHGSARSLATVAGGTVSSLVLMTLSVLGLWSAASTAPLLFNVARLLGVGYLMLLGVNTWRVGTQTAHRVERGQAAAPRRALTRMWRDGFLVGISNPKDLLFFGALLPQFIDLAGALLPQFATLFLTWAAVDAVVMYSYAALGQRLLHWLVSAPRLLWFQRASGALLVGAGAVMALVRFDVA